MLDKIRVIKKEIGKSAEIVELDDVEKEIETFVKDPCIEYYPHPKKDVDFIVGLNAQSWDNPATVVLGERDEVLGGNILVVKKGENMKFVSLTEQEAQELLQDIRQRELNDTGINLAMARYDLRQAKRFAQGLAKGIEMD
ncbi:MAG: hypothetical protein J6A63_08845 [Clostridia bacterium]|nr:hypothetical protein [Clostridia bacterium]